MKGFRAGLLLLGMICLGTEAIQPGPRPLTRVSPHGAYAEARTIAPPSPPTTTGRPTDLINCSLPAVTGPCRAHIPRYHFDLLTGECHRFIYGGCGGNGNNFETIKQCQAFGQRCILASKKGILENLGFGWRP